MTGTESTPDARPVVNIASALSVIARQRPDALAVACPVGPGRLDYHEWSFARLDRESDVLARGLSAIGIGRGVRTALMVKPGLEFFALTFALFKAGAVPILIDPGMGIRNLGRCLAEAEPIGFVGIPAAQMARRLLGWGRRTIRLTVTVKPLRSPVGPGRQSPRLDGSPSGRVRLSLAQVAARGYSEEPFAAAATTADEMAAILFTSGSTGAPKGAVYTHGIFAAQVAMLRDLYRIEPGEVDLCTFPLFALFAPALGMTSIVPDMDATRPGRVDPPRIFRAIERYQATNMFGSPALLKRVGEWRPEERQRLPSLRRVISAGAPVPARVLETFGRRLEPGVPIYTPYGATESLPVSSIAAAEILAETQNRIAEGAGVCVGLPVPGMQVEIIRISDEPIPHWTDDLRVAPGTIGEIAVLGPVVTRSYFHRPEATALAKIAWPDGRIMHRMGDLGYRDERGRIWFCGRKSHRVRTATGDLYTIPCEAVFNVHPKVARTALVGIGAAGSQRPVLCVEPRAWPIPRAEKQLLIQELLHIAAAHAHTGVIDTFLFHRSFPVDIRHNSKIFREKLAVWAARRA
ncbi:MAG: fatty acid CoA ligase family protein [Isosphaeraceae bacterium]